MNNETVGSVTLSFQDIAYAPYRLYEPGRTWRVLDFLAQVAHVHFNDIGLTKKIIAPDTVENGLTIQYLPWITHKEMQEIVFCCRQFDLPSATGNFARGGIQAQIFKL